MSIPLNNANSAYRPPTSSEVLRLQDIFNHMGWSLVHVDNFAAFRKSDGTKYIFLENIANRDIDWQVPISEILYTQLRQLGEEENVR